MVVVYQQFYARVNKNNIDLNHYTHTHTHIRVRRVNRVLTSRRKRNLTINSRRSSGPPPTLPPSKPSTTTIVCTYRFYLYKRCVCVSVCVMCNDVRKNDVHIKKKIKQLKIKFKHYLKIKQFAYN